MKNRLENQALGRGNELRKELGLLDDRELAAFFGVDLTTIRNRRLAGRMPPSAKVGNVHLTSKDDIAAWMATEAVEARSNRERQLELRERALEGLVRKFAGIKKEVEERVQQEKAAKSETVATETPLRAVA